VKLLAQEAPDFIRPSQWPVNSPDLDPVDYAIWGKLQDRVYRCRIHDLVHLKHRLIEEWNDFSQHIIDEAVAQWRQRLQVCVCAHGGHFEHRL